jgi:hypothetical protein
MLFCLDSLETGQFSKDGLIVFYFLNESDHHVQNEIVGYIINWPQNIFFYFG